MVESPGIEPALQIRAQSRISCLPAGVVATGGERPTSSGDASARGPGGRAGGAVPTRRRALPRPRSGRRRWCVGTVRRAGLPRRRGVADCVSSCRASPCRRGGKSPALPPPSFHPDEAWRARLRTSLAAAPPTPLTASLVPGFALAAGQLARLAGFAGGVFRSSASIQFMLSRGDAFKSIPEVLAMSRRGAGPTMGVEVRSLTAQPWSVPPARRAEAFAGRGRTGHWRATCSPAGRAVQAACPGSAARWGRRCWPRPASGPPPRPRRVPVRSRIVGRARTARPADRYRAWGARRDGAGAGPARQPSPRRTDDLRRRPGRAAVQRFPMPSTPDRADAPPAHPAITAGAVDRRERRPCSRLPRRAGQERSPVMRLRSSPRRLDRSAPRRNSAGSTRPPPRARSRRTGSGSCPEGEAEGPRKISAFSARVSTVRAMTVDRSPSVEAAAGQSRPASPWRPTRALRLRDVSYAASWRRRSPPRHRGRG